MSLTIALEFPGNVRVVNAYADRLDDLKVDAANITSETPTLAHTVLFTEMANHLAAPPTGVKVVNRINVIAGGVQILHVVDNRIKEMELETNDVKETRNTLLVVMCASLKVAKMCPIAKVVGQDFAVQFRAVVDADDNVF